MKKKSFLDDPPGLFDHWNCLHPTYDRDLIRLCGSSHDYPQMVWPFFGAAISLIGVGCIICLIVTIFLVRNFFGKSLLSLPTRLGLDGSSSCFFL